MKNWTHRWIWVKRALHHTAVRHFLPCKDPCNVSKGCVHDQMPYSGMLALETTQKLWYFSRQRNPVADWNHLYDSCTVDTCVSEWRALRQRHYLRLSYFWSCQSRRNPSFSSSLVHPVSYPPNRHQKQWDVLQPLRCYCRHHLVLIVMMMAYFYLFQKIVI